MRVPRSVVSICVALPLMAAVGAPLAPEEREAFIARFVAQQQATETYQAELKQTLELRGLRRPVESAGRIYYRSPDALALVFEKPAGEFLIVAGGDLFVKKHRQRLRHRTIDPARAGHHDLLFMLALFRDGAAVTREHFDVAMTRTNADLLVRLSPKERDPHHRQPVAIDNWIAETTLEVSKLRLQFHGENAITYEFREPVRNQPIDPAVFQPPRTED